MFARQLKGSCLSTRILCVAPSYWKLFGSVRLSSTSGEPTSVSLLPLSPWTHYVLFELSLSPALVSRRGSRRPFLRTFAMLPASGCRPAWPMMVLS